MTFTIIIDTKEKQPWNFTIAGFRQKSAHLDTGDYTIQGFEKSFFLERKKSPSELCINLGKERVRFEAELERARSFRFKYLICEFTQEQLYNYPTNAKIPWRLKRQIRLKGHYATKTILALCEKYNIELVFCQNRATAEQKAIELINHAIKELRPE